MSLGDLGANLHLAVNDDQYSVYASATSATATFWRGAGQTPDNSIALADGDSVTVNGVALTLQQPLPNYRYYSANNFPLAADDRYTLVVRIDGNEVFHQATELRRTTVNPATGVVHFVGSPLVTWAPPFASTDGASARVLCDGAPEFQDAP
jgi:hypothetical protein